MPKKNFLHYLEEAQGKDILVISKIKDIIKFKEKIKDYKIIKEVFSFQHYGQGNQFAPVTYTNDENIMGGKYISSIENLKKEIEENQLYANNNSISYHIEYLDNDAVINKSFSTEEYQEEDEDEGEESYEYSSTEEEQKFFQYK